MVSITLHGNLPPSFEDSFTADAPDSGIDLSTDGTYLIGKDGTDVSYFAEVKNQKVTEFFCTDTSGTRIPTYVLTGHVRSLQVCYVCWNDENGNAVYCKKIPCGWM